MHVTYLLKICNKQHEQVQYSANESRFPREGKRIIQKWLATDQSFWIDPLLSSSSISISLYLLPIFLFMLPLNIKIINECIHCQ